MDKNKKKKGGIYVEERWVLKSFVDNMKKEGYTIKQLLKDYVYIGGSGYYCNDHTNPENESGFVSTKPYRKYMNEWVTHIDMNEIHDSRPHTNKCICGHKIKDNCWLMHAINRDIAPVVGNCCIENFLPELKIRHCDICDSEHKRWKYTICEDCEKKQKLKKKKIKEALRNKAILEKAKRKRNTTKWKRKYGMGW